jgi:hypothetical protein
MRILSICFLLFIAALNQQAAFADDYSRHGGRERWVDKEIKEEYWDGPCEVKIESKRGEFKRVIKCKDGIGADWGGEWKKEYWDGNCKVKQEAKVDEFKEEIKCEGRK